MFIVELILHSPRRIDSVGDTACYVVYRGDVREI